MDPKRSSARGVQLLRSYLKYVETGGLELGEERRDHPLNAFELAILRRLERNGLSVIPQYGASGYRIDFAIVHPDRPGELLLAVEADGAAYHSSPTARDRDRLRQQVLEKLGWRFHRIWSTDWFRNPDAETAKVLQAVEDAIRGDPPSATPVDEPPEPAPSSPPGRGPRPPIARGLPITEYAHSQLVAIGRWIESDQLLRTDDELLEAMMEELGFHRRGHRIVDSMRRAIREIRTGS
jgi:very-short-patch-repair endonuclease